MQALSQIGSALAALGVSVGLIFSFALLGRAVRSVLPKVAWSFPVDVLWDVHIGIAVGAGLATVLGMAGFFNPLIFAGAIAIGPLVSLSIKGSLIAPLRAFLDSIRAFREHRLMGFAIVAAMTIAVIPTAAPEIFYDALYYHLGLPAQYLMAGAIQWLPGVVHSAFPAYLDVLFGVCLGLGGVAVAKFFNLLLFVLGWCATAAFVYEVLGDRRAALMGAVTISTVPGVAVMSTMCGIDAALIGFVAMAGIAIARMPQAGPDKSKRLALFAAVGAGFVAGSKYTGLWLVGAFALSIFMELGPRLAFGLVVRFIGAAAFVAAPWYLRNLMVIGDPIYPVLSTLSGNGDAGWAIDRIRRDVPASGLSWGSLADLVVGLTNDPGRFGAGAQIGLLIPFGLAALLVGAWVVPSLRSWTVAVAAYFVLWLSQSSVVRYLYPVFPFCALGVAWAASGALERLRRPALVTAVFVIFALAPMSQAVRILDALYSGTDVAALFSGTLSNDDYLARRLAYYPAAQWVNAHTPPDAHVYYLGETRLLYLDRRVSFSSAYDYTEVARLLTPGAPPLFSQLRSRGITHLLINGREIQRLRSSYDYLPLSPDAEGRLRAALAECRIVFSKSGVQVCELPQ